MNSLITFKKVISPLLLGIVFSAYLENIPVHLTQPDGSSFDCFLTGDEFYVRMHDRDNYTILQHPLDGYYYYAESINGNIRPTIYKADQPIWWLGPKAEPASHRQQP